LFSSSHSLLDKYRRRQPNLPTQILTDACFIYRRELIKQPKSNAMILRGREIAYEAANAPTIPSSMPNYTHDQIRDLYGELDKNTRRAQENEYILQTPMIDAWNEKSLWNVPSPVKSQSSEECPLPKFRVDNNDQTSLMATYLSTGLSNKPRTISNTNDNKPIQGSFRTSIADRSSISPSPLLLNVCFDFNKLNTTSTSSSQLFNNEDDEYPIQNQLNKISPSPDQSHKHAELPPMVSQTMDVDSLIDLDEETTVSYCTANESRTDVIYPLILTTKGSILQPSSNSNSFVRENDGLNTITSPDSSLYYDALTSSIEANKRNDFFDNLFEETKTFHYSQNQSSEINMNRLKIKNEQIEITNTDFLNNLLFIYDDITTPSDEEAKDDSGGYSYKIITDDQKEDVRAENLNTMLHETLTSPFQKSSNKIDDFEAIIHKAEALVKQYIEPEHNLTAADADNPSEIISDSLLDHQTTTEIDEEFEDLYHRYLTKLDQYELTKQQINEFGQNQHTLTPISEESLTIAEHVSNMYDDKPSQIDQFCLTLKVQRQSNHIGHYGFEIEQTLNGKIIISSIINSNYCLDLNIDDEIISINNHSLFTTLEQCHLLFNSLWYNQYEYVEITVIKSGHIPRILSK
jgi:hypothetical protein